MATSLPVTSTVPPATKTELVSVERIQKVVDKIVSNFAPERIVLFGSYAYGQPKPWSDVDLLVVMEVGDLTRRQQRREINRILSYNGFSLDIVVRTPADIQDRYESRDFFLQEIINRGRIVYARSNS